MLENSTVLSGTNPTFPGRAIVVQFNGNVATIHQAAVGFLDRCVLTIVYPSTGTTTATMFINVAGFEAMQIEMLPGSVITYDAALSSTESQPALTLTVKMTGGDVDGKVSGYVIRGGDGAALRR